MTINYPTFPTGAPEVSGLGQAGDHYSQHSGVAFNENFDWFISNDGKALPITAQNQFSDVSTMDEMVGAILAPLGITHRATI